MTKATTNGAVDDVEILNTMSFEELRKRARFLEGDVDGKLVSLSRLASNYGSSQPGSKSSAEVVPLISNDDQ